MTVRQYIGARYVPIFADPIQWDSTNSYEPLTVVMNQGTSYVSKQSVPVGIEITNETYWLRWADYNAQIEEYIRQVQTYSASITALNNALPIANFDANDTVKDAIDDIAALLPGTDFTTENTVKDAIDDIAALLPDTDFTAENTVKDAIDDIAALLPDTDFTAENTVKDAIDALDNSIKNYIDLRTPFVMPEMYGAVGDGETDDYNAFKDMFDDIQDKTTIVISKKTYLISQTLDVTQNQISIVGISNGEYQPVIEFTSEQNEDVLFYVTGYSFNAQDVIFKTLNDAIAIDLDRDSAERSGDIDAIINACGLYNAKTGIRIRGRNVRVTNCLFSGCTNGVEVMNMAINTAIRGIIINSNRFHSCTIGIKDDTARYSQIHAIQIINNYFDFIAVCYVGISDGLMFNNNVCYQSAASTTIMVSVTTSINKSHFQIANNVFDAMSATPYRTAIQIGSSVIGFASISNNVIATNYTSGHPVIVQASPSVLSPLYLAIVGNIINANTTDAVVYFEVPENKPRKGIFANNVIINDSTGAASSGIPSGVTQANNVTA